MATAVTIYRLCVDGDMENDVQFSSILNNVIMNEWLFILHILYCPVFWLQHFDCL